MKVRVHCNDVDLAVDVTNQWVECKSLLVAVGKVCEPCKGDDEHP